MQKLEKKVVKEVLEKKVGKKLEQAISPFPSKKKKVIKKYYIWKEFLTQSKIYDKGIKFKRETYSTCNITSNHTKNMSWLPFQNIKSVIWQF